MRSQCGGGRHPRANDSDPTLPGLCSSRSGPEWVPLEFDEQNEGFEATSITLCDVAKDGQLNIDGLGIH